MRRMITGAVSCWHSNIETKQNDFQSSVHTNLTETKTNKISGAKPRQSSKLSPASPAKRQQSVTTRWQTAIVNERFNHLPSNRDLELSRTELDRKWP